MNKDFVLLLAVLTLGTASHAAGPITDNPPASMIRQPNSQQAQQASNTPSSGTSTTTIDTKTIYYPNANIDSAVAKYRKGNYVGCLQETLSLINKNPSDSVPHYYAALAYTKVGDNSGAIAEYDKVISLNKNSALVNYSKKGKDCLTGGPLCAPAADTGKEAAQPDDLDKFIAAPYGNGLSPELEREIRQKQLDRIQKQINVKEELKPDDIERLRRLEQKSEVVNGEKIAMTSDEEILSAIKTLRDAGITISVQQPNYTNQIYQDPQMAEMSALLGNNNNQNNSFNMLPMMLYEQGKSGQNMDPQVIQAMMMSSMMPDFGLNTNDKDR